MRLRSEKIQFPVGLTIYRPIFLVQSHKSFCFIQDESIAYNETMDFPEFESQSFDLSNTIPINKCEFKGVIAKFYEPTTCRFLALKFYKDEESGVKYHVLLERMIMVEVLKVSASNFSQFQGIFHNKDSNQFIFCLEYGSANIDEILGIRLQEKKPYSCNEIAYILRILLESLRNLKKEAKIAHRNIKCENIIVLAESPNNWVYKIFNFGSACKLSSKNKSSTINFSLISSHCPLYEAPEVEQGWDLKNSLLEYDPFKADLYSIGVVALKLMGFTDEWIQKKKQPREILNYESKYQDLSGIINKMLRKTLKKTFFDYEDILEDKEFQQIKKVQPNESEFVNKLKVKESKINEILKIKQKIIEDNNPKKSSTGEDKGFKSKEIDSPLKEEVILLFFFDRSFFVSFWIFS